MAIEQAWAIWVTGLPASGKSTFVSALKAEIDSLGVDVAVLESDALRPVFTPLAAYQQDDREYFYRVLTFVGTLLTQHGVPVIFDATANLRRIRTEARRQIPRFLEVYVDLPLATCMDRDPKGIYKKGREDQTMSVPGLQAPYEPPENPEVTMRSGKDSVAETAQRIVALLRERKFI